MALGEKLKQARLKKNFSQEYMAEMLEVSQKTYSNFENDKTTPNFSQIESISNILETSVLDFLTSEKISFNQTNSHRQNNGVVINSLSNKLIGQYELRIKKQDEEILYLKGLLERFMKYCFGRLSVTRLRQAQRFVLNKKNLPFLRGFYFVASTGSA